MDRNRKRPHHDDHQAPSKRPIKGSKEFNKQTFSNRCKYVKANLPHLSSDIDTIFKPPPPLPDVPDETLRTGAFTHHSLMNSKNLYVSSLEPIISFERLEFLGDSYIELISARLIYHRYPHLGPGRMTQLREYLVGNSSLGSISREYGLDKKIRVADPDLASKSGGWQKNLADSFEAFVAAVVLSNGAEGFAIAEKWLHALFLPMLVAYAPDPATSYYDFGSSISPVEAMKAVEVGGIAVPQPSRPNISDATTDSSANSPKTANHSEMASNAPQQDPKIELQKRIQHKDMSLDYDELEPMTTVNQYQHWVIGCFASTKGTPKSERTLLGRGEGINKKVAGRKAAEDALTNNADLVEKWAMKRKQALDERDRRLAAETEKKVLATPPKSDATGAS